MNAQGSSARRSPAQCSQGTATRRRSRVPARGGAAAEREQHVGVRTSRSHGLAAPDGVPGLRLGREPVREGTDRNLRPPRPTRHSQRRRHPPRCEYARRRAAHRSAGRARPYAGDAQRARAGPHWLDARGGRARAVFARAKVLVREGMRKQVSVINTGCTARAARRVYYCVHPAVAFFGAWD